MFLLRVFGAAVPGVYPLRGEVVIFDPLQVLGFYVWPTVGAYWLQGYLAHKKQPPPLGPP